MSISVYPAFALCGIQIANGEHKIYFIMMRHTLCFVEQSIYICSYLTWCNIIIYSMLFRSHSPQAYNTSLLMQDSNLNVAARCTDYLCRSAPSDFPCQRESTQTTSKEDKMPPKLICELLSLTNDYFNRCTLIPNSITVRAVKLNSIHFVCNWNSIVLFLRGVSVLE